MQELATILCPQNRTQGRCVLQYSDSMITTPSSPAPSCSPARGCWTSGSTTRGHARTPGHSTPTVSSAGRTSRYEGNLISHCCPLCSCDDDIITLLLAGVLQGPVSRGERSQDSRGWSREDWVGEGDGQEELQQLLSRGLLRCRSPHVSPRVTCHAVTPCQGCARCRACVTAS